MKVDSLHFLDLGQTVKQLQTIGSPKYQADHKRNLQSVKAFQES